MGVVGAVSRTPAELAREVRQLLRQAESALSGGITFPPRGPEFDKASAALAELEAQAEAGKQRLADAPSPADQAECDGSVECRAAVHIHGCFAERPSA